MIIFDQNKFVREPLVSVRILAYNHEKYITKAIESVLNQKCDFLYEVIIGEDCSTDDTRDICIEYQKKFPEKIKLILNESNVGLQSNYKNVNNEIRGKYIACCPGDDYWCDDLKLQKQVECLEHNPEVGLCYTNVITCDGNGKENNTPLLDINFLPNSFEEQLFKTCYMAPNTWMYRRSTTEKICEQQLWFTDESLATALDFLHESKMFFIDEVTTVYRIRENSLANQIDSQKRWKYEFGILKMQLYYAKKYGCSEELINRIYLQAYPNFTISALEANDQIFINEMLKFYNRYGMEMKFFVDKCRNYVEIKKQYNRILCSYSYRIGKLFLKPFSLLKKIIKG